MSAVSVYVHLAGREPVRLSGRAAMAIVDPAPIEASGRSVVPELVGAGLYDGDQFTALGRQVAAVLAAEAHDGA